MNEHYLEKIRTEFPELSFTDAKFIDEGQDNFVVILDDTWIIRFPREDVDVFKQEVRLLQTLRTSTDIPVPGYELIAQDGSFGGYKMIPGSELTEEVFAKMSEEEQELVIQQLSRFLSDLHSLSPELITNMGEWHPSELWRWRDRFNNERKEYIAPHISADVLADIETFYEKFVDLPRPYEKVVHDDLSTDHIFTNHDGKGVSGVIDFADATVNDPAVDFALLWMYGDHIPARVYERYVYNDDPELLARSRWYLVRFLTGELYYSLRDGLTERFESDLALLKKHLPILLQAE